MVGGRNEMKKNKYLMLFTSTFMISMFTFGGGYVIISLLKKKFSDELEWIEGKEMLNLAAIAQSSPGAVAVNAAILVGYKVAGVRGTLVSILGTVIPPFLIISGISFCYTAFRENYIVSAVLKGMQSGVVAVIVDVTLNLGKNMVYESGKEALIIMVLVFSAVYFYSINIAVVILICALLGGIQTFFKLRREK